MNIEVLEERAVMAASVVNGTLVVTGTTSPDIIDVTATNASTYVVTMNGSAKSFPTTGMTRIQIDALNGNDVIRIAPSVSIPSRVAGGAGNDSMTGGSGGDVFVDAMNGTDAIDGGLGSDRIEFTGTAGDDSIISAAVSGGGIVVRYRVNGGLVGGLSKVVGLEAMSFALLEGNDLLDIEGVAKLNPIGTSSWLSIAAVGGPGNDVLFGDLGDDVLDGSAGDDTVYGIDGADTFPWNVDGTANQQAGDKFDGGPGSDRFAFVGTNGKDELVSHTIASVATSIGYKVDGSLKGTISGLRDLELLSFDLLSGDDLLDIEGAAAWNSSSFNLKIEAFGRAGNDTLFGDRGDDKLDGGSGDDVTYGIEGNDEFAWSADGAANQSVGDSFDGGPGNDVMRFSGSDAKDSIVSSSLNGIATVINFAANGLYQGKVSGLKDLDTLEFNLLGGDDYLDVEGAALWNDAGANLSIDAKGGAGNDTLYGDLGNDVLDGEAGNDSVNGVEGNDVLVWSIDENSNQLSEDAFDGGPGRDQVLTNGTSKADQIVSRSTNGVAYILRYAVDGVLKGSIRRIKGLESLWFDLKEGNDLLDIEGAAKMNQDASGNLAITAYGRAGNDTLYGDLGNDLLDGGFGDDDVHGVEGNDVFVWGLEGVSAVNGDVFDGGPGLDQVQTTGTDNIDSIESSSVNGVATRLTYGTGFIRLLKGMETLYFDLKEGNDVLDIEGVVRMNQDATARLMIEAYGRGGNDTLYGDLGDDTLDGGTGGDTLYGLLGNDRLQGGTGSDFMQGNDGNDVIVGDEGDDSLIGGDGRDRLYGGENDDRLEGGTGNDFLYGDSGNDALIGFTGVNRLEGGTGSDRFLEFDGADLEADYSSSQDVRFYFANTTERAWADAEMAQVDQGLDFAFRRTGSTRILKLSAGAGLLFVRQVANSGPFPAAADNNSHGLINVYDAAFGGNAAATIVHELGHNWDEPYENASVVAFRNLSGWRQRPGVNTVRSLRGDWYYNANASFAQQFFTPPNGTRTEYGRWSPYEDFATCFQFVITSNTQLPADKASAINAFLDSLR